MRILAAVIWVIGLCAVLGSTCPAAAQMNADALQASLDAVAPGATIELPDGAIRTARPLILKRSGTEAAPIVIRARNRGKAIIEGKAGLELRGAAHVIIEGIAFLHESQTPAVRLVDCSHVRITRCRFRLDPGVVKRQNWIAITGGKSEQNRIDHNLFDDLATDGAFIAIDGSEAEPWQVSKGDRIDYNHFRGIARREGGGARAMRIGWTRLAPSQGNTIVEFNLFEGCSGDEEIVTVRASAQTVRYNTFLNCAGHLALRMGADNVVEGNFFFSENNKEGVGGLCVHGDHAKVFNNYFEGLTIPALVIGNGAPQVGPGDAPRPAATRAQIVFNTWVNCVGGAIEAGNTRGGVLTVPASASTIANNVAIGYGDDLLYIKDKGDGIKWAGNIMFHAGSKAKIGIDVPDNQITVTFPKLRNQGGIWRLGPNSPAIDFAEGEYDFVTADIDGQPRPRKMDVGCDEFATSPIKQRPFAAADVGVDAP